MIISFTGTHSSGKTTLLNILKLDPLFKLYTIYDLITRDIQRLGKKINELGDNDTQISIISSHVINLMSPGLNKLMDRCILDGLVYTTYLRQTKPISDDVMAFAHSSFHCLINKYDIIFHLEPEAEIEDDGVRSINKDFQFDIMNIFNEYINLYKLEMFVFKISGTILLRIKKIKYIYLTIKFNEINNE